MNTTNEAAMVRETMNAVTVPADEAAALFQPTLTDADRRRHGMGGETFDLPDARRFVVHTANINPTTCEWCEGSREILIDQGDGFTPDQCLACDDGTVPAVVTLAVQCETCEGRRYQTTGDLFSGRDNGPCMTCMTAGFRPVGVATVAHCWPIVRDEDWTYEMQEDGTPYVVLTSKRPPHFLSCAPFPEVVYFPSGVEQGVDITGQVVGTPTPNLYLLELVDAVAT